MCTQKQSKRITEQSEDLILWGDAILQQRRRNKKTRALALPFITNWRIKRQIRINEGDLGVIWAWQNIFHAENKNQMRWGVEVIDWLNLGFFCLLSLLFLFTACTEEFMYFFCFFFLFTACTLIIFFFHIVKIYVFSLLFLVYCVHINHFFLPCCKNLCTFFAFFGLQCAHWSFFFFSIVRIYILSLFFLFPAYTSIIFLFYKNQCTFCFCFCLQRAL